MINNTLKLGIKEPKEIFKSFHYVHYVKIRPYYGKILPLGMIIWKKNLKTLQTEDASTHIIAFWPIGIW